MKSADKKADIIVISGGGGGLPAAVAAAESGLKVILLEKRGGIGGNAAMAWGIFASESPVQKQEMVNSRNDLLFKQFMDWARWKIDPQIIRSFIWKSGETIRWLEEKGLAFQLIRYSPGQEPAVWHIPKGRGGRLGQGARKSV
jgi:fumarate reductase flavoprotein subunit